MYLHRKLDDYLERWFALPDHKPLIVQGARQIGKTESIRHFAKGRYKSYIEINFYEEPKFKSIISDGFSVEDIVKNITLQNPKAEFIPNNTLIFYDELQDFPEIATSLKFFKQDGRYDVICSGSLLGIHFGRIESNSVGYKTDYHMYSMDFEEFLWAKGYDDETINDIYDHMREKKPFSKTELALFENIFMEYCLLGGMPEVVSTYIKNNSFENIEQLQQQLIADYEEDIQKYVVGLEKTRVLNVFRHIPVQLARENKKFQVSKLGGGNFEDYRGCIEWLSRAGVINICYCLHYPELPLKGNYDLKKLKIYMTDTGLFLAMMDEESRADVWSRKNMDVYKGALYESIVAEALIKSGYDGLYYYKKENSTLEEDFFVRTSDELIPIEVKSTNGNSKSLKTLIQNENAYPDIKRGIKLIRGNIGSGNGIDTYPLFCTFLIRRMITNNDL